MEMLKKLAKRIQKEINQAEDYCMQAYLVKHDEVETAQLFVELSRGEIDHAKKLLAEGVRLIKTQSIHVLPYETKEAMHQKVAMDITAEFNDCKKIWDWEQRIAMETITEIEYKLNQFRTMP